MPLTLTNQAGQEVVIGEDTPFVVARVSTLVITDTMGRYDDRSDEDRRGTISVSIPLPQARTLAGRRVVLFIVEE